MSDETADSPWTLRTPSGQSEYQAWRDEAAKPPALVVQVGKSQLRYHLAALDDLHAMLAAHGDWMPLGSADEQKPAADGKWRRGRGPPTTRWAAGTGSRRACAGGSPTTCRRCLRRWARRGGAQPAQQPHARDLSFSRPSAFRVVAAEPVDVSGRARAAAAERRPQSCGIRGLVPSARAAAAGA
jgi:hypothetical protein